MPSYNLSINGKTYTVDADARMPLLWVIRDLVGLTGTKYGCGISQCGACTVHLNNNPVRSCSLPVSAVKSVDDSATRAVPGVKHVFTVQRPVFANLYEGVAVVADTIWAAMQGRKVLKVTWDDEGFEHLDTEKIVTRMREDIDNCIRSAPAPSAFDKAFQQSVKKIDAVYETPYQSHSCMEPLNCIANVQDNRIEIWGPIQEAN